MATATQIANKHCSRPAAQICIATGRREDERAAGCIARSRWIWLRWMESRLLWTESIVNRNSMFTQRRPNRDAYSRSLWTLHARLNTARSFKDQGRGQCFIHGSCPASVVSRLTAHKNARPQPDMYHPAGGILQNIG